MSEEELCERKISVLVETFNSTISKDYSPSPTMTVLLANGEFKFRIYVGKSPLLEINSTDVTVQHALLVVESSIHAFIAGMKTHMLATRR